MKENTINTILAGILFVLCVGIAIKETEYKRFDRFTWDIGVFAEEGEPMQIHECDFEGNFYAVDKDDIMQDRHINYSESDVKNRLYPERALIQWFSYKENKFFEARIQLPGDLVSQVGKELRVAQWKDYKSRGYNENQQDMPVHFYAELKPKGLVTIWMSDLDSTKKICTNQALEIQVNWNEFHPDSTVSRDEWIELVLNRYDWNLIVNLPHNHTVEEINVSTFADIDYSFKEEKDPADPNLIPKAIPYWIMITWKDNSGHEYGTSIYFEEKQILDCFHELYKGDKSGKSSLVVTVNEENSALNLVMKKGEKELKAPYIEEYGKINKHK